MAELPATWIEKLLEVTSAFSRARTAREVGEVAVLVGEKALGATAGWVSLVTRDGEQLEIVAAHGMTPEERRRLARLPTSNPNPSCVVARTGQSQFFESQEQFEAGYGDFARQMRGHGGPRALLALLSGDRP